MANAVPRPPKRRLRIVFREIDRDSIRSRPYTEAEEREVSAFFQKLRAENDKNPEIVALRARLANKQLANQ